MKKLLAAALVCAASLGNACAADIGARAAALLKASPDKQFSIMHIPSASGYVSNKLMIAALKSGTESKAVLHIVEMLQRPAPVDLAVTSDNDEIGAATLERAFASLKGKTVTPQQVAYIGSKERGETLSAKAAEIGVTLLVVPVE